MPVEDLRRRPKIVARTKPPFLKKSPRKVTPKRPSKSPPKRSSKSPYKARRTALFTEGTIVLPLRVFLTKFINITCTCIGKSWKELWKNYKGIAKAKARKLKDTAKVRLTLLRV